MKILVIVFKDLNGIAPHHISELIKIRKCSFYGLRSNSATLLERPNGRMLKTLGDRTFQAAVPSLWNSLPARLQQIDTLTQFNAKLKTHFFRLAQLLVNILFFAFFRVLKYSFSSSLLSNYQVFYIIFSNFFYIFSNFFYHNLFEVISFYHIDIFEQTTSSLKILYILLQSLFFVL